MEKESAPDFIVIDDDNINNVICQKIIQITIPDASVWTFTDPEKGLEHIMSAYSGHDSKSAILFLDINMPVLNGWDVLERFKVFPELVKKHVKIFMLSSSVDPVDKEKASADTIVSGYITKSLSQVKLRAIFPDHMKQPLRA